MVGNHPMKSRFLPLLCSLLLAGCGNGEPCLDITTEGSLKASLLKVRDSVPVEQRENFDEAYKLVAMQGIDMFSLMGQPEAIWEASLLVRLKTNVHGKSAAEIFALAGPIRAERMAAQTKQEAELAAAQDLQDAELAAAQDLGERSERVRSLLAEIRDLRESHDFDAAMVRLEEADEIWGNREDSNSWGKNTAESIEEEAKETKESMELFLLETAAIETINLYEFEATRIDTFTQKNLAAVRLKLKNNGDRTITEVEVLIEFRDGEGRAIHEETIAPVSSSSWTRSSTLKPGFISSMAEGKYFTFENVPSEWETGKASAVIVAVSLEE